MRCCSTAVASVAALNGGLQWAMWVCGAIGLATIPVGFALIRRERLQRPGRRDDLLAAVPAHEQATGCKPLSHLRVRGLRQGPKRRYRRLQMER